MTRAGLERGGMRLLERGLRHLSDDENPMEHAITKAQFAELLALGPKVESRRWPALRREARAALRDLGVDSHKVTTVATDAIAWGRAAAASPRLTAREVEVLALLAEGHSYREIAQRLDIGWRTAQSHARNIYGKLEVRGKVEAANRARELGILSAFVDSA